MITQGTGKLGIRWDVPPGQYFLYDLRANYTRFVAQTGVRIAESRAPEITQWMKENAPWKDQTGVARSNLRARVEDPRTDEQIRQDRADEKVAKSANRRALTALNRERRRAGRSETSNLPASRRTTVPKRDRLPVVNIIFEHGDRRIVPHAIWLEIAHQGIYSIIAPAVHYWNQKLMNDVQRIINLGIRGAPSAVRRMPARPDFIGGLKGTRRGDEFDVSKVSPSRLSDERSARDVGYTRTGRKRGG